MYITLQLEEPEQIKFKVWMKVDNEVYITIFRTNPVIGEHVLQYVKNTIWAQNNSQIIQVSQELIENLQEKQ